MPSFHGILVQSKNPPTSDEWVVAVIGAPDELGPLASYDPRSEHRCSKAGWSASWVADRGPIRDITNPTAAPEAAAIYRLDSR